MKNFVFIGTFVWTLGVMSASSQAIGASLSESTDWLSNGAIDQRLIEQMIQFEAAGTSLSPAYARDFAKRIQTRLAQSNQHKMAALERLQAEGVESVECESEARAHFLISDSISKLEREFERGVVEVEVTGCLTQGDPLLIESILMSSEYQLRAFPELSEFTVDGNRVCSRAHVGTSVVTLPPSRCELFEQLSDSSSITHRTQLILSRSQSSVPELFFTMGATEARTLPNGSIGFYAHFFVRALDSEFMTKKMGGEKKITESQLHALQVLKQMISEKLSQ